MARHARTHLQVVHAHHHLIRLAFADHWAIVTFRAVKGLSFRATNSAHVKMQPTEAAPVYQMPTHLASVALLGTATLSAAKALMSARNLAFARRLLIKAAAASCLPSPQQRLRHLRHLHLTHATWTAQT